LIGELGSVGDGVKKFAASTIGSSPGRGLRPCIEMIKTAPASGSGACCRVSGSVRRTIVLVTDRFVGGHCGSYLRDENNDRLNCAP